MKNEKSYIERYIGERELGKRIRLLYLEDSGIDWFYKSTCLSKGEVREVERKWSNRFTPSKYLYGYSIFIALVVLFSWMITWTSTQVLSVLALVVLILSGGVSALLNKDNIEKLDSKFYDLVKSTKDSIVYFVGKDFVLSDKSTRIIQLELVSFTNLFFTVAWMLLFGLFSKIGASNDSLSIFFTTIIDKTTLSLGGSNGWDINHMIYYVILGSLTASSKLSEEYRVFQDGYFHRYFNRQNIWNLVLFVGYSFLCYRRISILEEFPLSSPDWGVVLEYWGVFILGLQMFLAVFIHQWYTSQNWIGRKSKLLYTALLFLLAPYFIIGVFGLQVLPGIVIILLCYSLLWIFKFAKITLEVSSAVKAIGYLIGVGIAIYKVFEAFNLF